MSSAEAPLVIDGHADILLDVYSRRRKGATHVLRDRHLQRLRAGGVSAVVMAVFLEPFRLETAVRDTLLTLDDLHEEIAESPDDFVLATSAAHLEPEYRQGRIALVPAIEGGEAVGEDLGVLRMFYRLGVRSFGLTWFRRTLIGDGTGVGDAGGGLTPFGRKVVAELNRLRMVVDVSHLNERGFWDVLEHSTAPVIASHSNARALVDNPRNLTDDQIRALASVGGVMGLNAWHEFVAPSNASLGDLVDHLDHIVAIAGIEYVALGLDLLDYLPDYADEPVLRGLADASKIPALAEEMARRGYDDAAIRAVLGENLRRVWTNVLG